MGTIAYPIDKEGMEKAKTLIRDLKITCAIYKIPMFATIVINDVDDGTEYYSEVFGPGANDISLNDDKIRKHILVQNGLTVVPGREYHEISSDVIVKLKEGEDSA